MEHVTVEPAHEQRVYCVPPLGTEANSDEGLERTNSGQLWPRMDARLCVAVSGRVGVYCHCDPDRRAGAIAHLGRRAGAWSRTTRSAV